MQGYYFAKPMPGNEFVKFAAGEPELACTA
jgi:hypothetical protein